MKKKFYSFWGVSQLLVGAMTIGLVSCEKSSELLYDFSETSESSIQSRAISVADSVSLFSNIDEFKKKPETKSGQRRNSVAGLSKIDRQTVGFLIRIS